MNTIAGCEVTAIWTVAHPRVIPADALSVQDDLAPQVQWRRCLEDLRNLKALRDDWDGLGALAPDPQLIDSAFVVLRPLQKDGADVPEVSATPTGGVFLEWQGDDIYLEAEIEQPHIVSWMRQRPACKTEHWQEELPAGRADSSSANANLRFQDQVACGSAS